jgi:hypothetical protein
MKLAILLCFAVTITADAIETTRPEPLILPASVRLIEPTSGPKALVLYSPEGNRVADCAKSNGDLKFSECKIENGFTLDDLMNAFVQAYVKKGKE